MTRQIEDFQTFDLLREHQQSASSLQQHGKKVSPLALWVAFFFDLALCCLFRCPQRQTKQSSLVVDFIFLV